MEYHFLTPVWGADYIERFLRVGLPSLLAKGNLPCFRGTRAVFHVYSRSWELPVLLRAPAFQALQALMTCELHAIDHLDVSDPHNPYSPMSRCHQKGLERAAQAGACCFLVPPDSVWSDGSFARFKALSDAGTKAILLAGVRTCAAEMEEALEPFQTHGSLPVPARQLVRLALDHLHPMSLGHLSDRGRFRAIQNLLWEIEGAGLLARCFHLHPVMVRPNGAAWDSLSTVDDDLIPVICRSLSDLHIVTDSDEACMFELSDLEHGAANNKADFYSAEDIAFWIRTGTNAFHRAFIDFPIFLHTSELNDRWRPILDEAARVVDASFKPILAEAAGDSAADAASASSGRLLSWTKWCVRHLWRRARWLAKSVYQLLLRPVYRRLQVLEQRPPMTELQNLRSTILYLQRKVALASRADRARNAPGDAGYGFGSKRETLSKSA